MRISTKTLTSLLLVTTVATALPAIGAKGKTRSDQRLERILQKHDRKAEIRAEILGISAFDFRTLSKHMPLSDIVKRHGFTSVRDFRVALMGKLRSELRQRGWSNRRIDQFVLLRSDRIA